MNKTYLMTLIVIATAFSFAPPAAAVGEVDLNSIGDCTHAYDVLCWGDDECHYFHPVGWQCSQGYCILYVGPGNCTTLDDVTEVVT